MLQNATISVVLADDHRMLREALRGMLDGDRGIEVVGEAATGNETLALVAAVAPDVLVLDIGLPELNGVEVARRLRVSRSPVKLVALSAYADRHSVREMLKAGAAAYVTKTAPGSDLVRAIRAAATGQSYLSPEVARTVLGDYASGSPPFAPPRSCLGARERDVLTLIAEGAHSPGIASHLGIAVATVEVHRRNIMRKLDLHSVAALTKYAIREGLTGP